MKSEEIVNNFSFKGIMEKFNLFWKKLSGFFLNKKKLVVLIFGGLVLNIIGVLALKFFFPFNQETVILHYNAFLGIDEVEFAFSANKIRIFMPLIGGGLIWLINLLLGFFLFFFNQEAVLEEENRPEKFKISRLGAYLLWLAGDIVQVFVLVYVLAVIFINS